MGEVVRIEYELVWVSDDDDQYLYLTQCKVDAKGSQSAKSICIYSAYVDEDPDLREDIVEEYLLMTKLKFAMTVEQLIEEEEKEDDVSGYPDLTQYDNFEVIRRVDEYSAPLYGCFYEEVTI